MSAEEFSISPINMTILYPGQGKNGFSLMIQQQQFGVWSVCQFDALRGNYFYLPFISQDLARLHNGQIWSLMKENGFQLT